MSIVIAIAGGSGSGKSTLAKNLLSILQSSVLITHDDYYRKDNPSSADFNYDEPKAFETELLIEHIDRLLSGSAVDAPLYDYSHHKRSEKSRRIEPAEVIIIEGILTLENEELRKRATLKIFVDTPEKERLKRRIRRDGRDRGRTEESVIKQFESTVKPMHELYVEPEKSFADITVKNGGKDPCVLKMICERIKALIKTE
jgi:uridine kinase